MGRKIAASLVLSAATWFGVGSSAWGQVGQPQYISPGFSSAGNPGSAAAAQAAAGAGLNAPAGMNGMSGMSGMSSLSGSASGGFTNPLMSPYMNPYILATQANSASGTAALYFMATQQAYASPAGSMALMRYRGMDPNAQPATPMRTTFRATSIPGAGAASYFGRTGTYGSGLNRYYNRTPTRKPAKGH